MFSKWDLHILSYKVPISSYKIAFLHFRCFLLTDLARLPGLLCLGSAELVLPCSLPRFALSLPPTSLSREAAFGRLHKGGRAPSAPARLCGFPCEACWRPRQGKARQTARQDQLSRAKAKQARQPSQISDFLTYSAIC